MLFIDNKDSVFCILHKSIDLETTRNVHTLCRQCPSTVASLALGAVESCRTGLT